MTVLGIHSLIYRLKTTPSLQLQFRDAPADVLIEFDLTPGERDALISGDVQALWRMGVHPMLLLPYSRIAGVPGERYRELLAQLKGVRTLRSDG